MIGSAQPFGRGKDQKGARLRRGQAGFSLLEALIGMVMVTLLIGAGATGLQALQQTSSEANQISRLDSLLVATSEAVQAVPYVGCAEPIAYQSSIENSESLRTQSERYVQQTAAGTPVIRVLAVDASTGCAATATAGDSGIQKVSLEVTSNGKTRLATVTKFDPAKRLRLPKAVIDPEVLQSSPGDVRAIFSLTAKDSSAEEGLLCFEWDCGPSAEPGYPSTALYGSPDQQMLCRYQADPPDPANPEPLKVRVTLTVTDNAGQTSTTTAELEVQDRVDPRPQPTAVANASVAEGTAPVVVSFNSEGSAAPSGAITSYSWEFDDPDSGDASNQSSSPSPTHTFAYSGTYRVKLTVTDDVGLQGVDFVQVKVVVLGTDPPKASFAQPPPQFAPSSIAFDASAVTFGGSSVSSYAWDFGDGSTFNGKSTTKIYPVAGNYTVRLIVTDSGGRQSIPFSLVVKVKSLSAPTNFRVTGSQAWAIFSKGSMSFAWNRIDAPGETLEVEINIFDANTGTLCWPASKSRSVVYEQGSGSQTYKWTDESLLAGDHFCAGTMYKVRARLIKVVAGTKYKGTEWSPTIFKGV